MLYSEYKHSDEGSNMRQVPDAMAERLVAAATEFADRGFEATRIEDLAAVTGIPKATLYYYFDGKEDVLGFLLRRMLERADAAVSAAVAGPGSAAQRIAAVIDAQLGVMAEEPAVCKLLILNLGRVGAIPD